jgi:dTDP-4-dehydrorhamnose reductase
MEKIKNKILVLGSTGMLGHVLYDTIKQHTNYEVVDLVFRHKLNKNSIICDVTDKYKLADVVEKVNPDIIVNCIGVLIKGSTYNPSNAIYINSFLPHYLVTLAENCNARVIHISTDCVFSGKKGGYSESDYKDANDIYGRSKALGELLGDNHLTFRTSIIGPEIKEAGEGLLHWFLKQEVSINGYTKAFWGGLTTVELSKAIIAAIDQNISGLIHVTNGEAISKFDMLQMFKTAFNRSLLTIESSEGKKIDKSLKSERKDFEYTVPSYTQMFTEMYRHMKDNEMVYSKNYIF